jgi:hypothetical protein
MPWLPMVLSHTLFCGRRRWQFEGVVVRRASWQKTILQQPSVENLPQAWEKCRLKPHIVPQPNISSEMSYATIRCRSD